MGVITHFYWPPVNPGFILFSYRRFEANRLRCDNEKMRKIGIAVLMCCGAIAPWAFGESVAADVPAPDPLSKALPADIPQRAQRFVDERTALWRQRLKLEDWRISAVMTRRIDLAPMTLGGIRWDKSKKTAVIWVLDPADYKLPYQAMLNDMELTVVHELVHLELTSLPKSEAHRGNEERAVSGLAGALLELDRRKQ